MKKRGGKKRSRRSSGFVSNIRAGYVKFKKSNPKSFFASLFGVVRTTFRVIVGLITAFFVLSLLSLLFIPSQSLRDGNVAIIPIKGVIVTEASSSAFASSGLASNDIIEMLKTADESDVSAVILEINSPGGSPVASEEIASQVKKMSKPVYAIIREIGASGAYWIASSADLIFANRMSLTGSIGVVASHLEFSGLLDDYNITYRRLVAGKYKDTGSPYRQMSDEELDLFQGELDKIHNIFIREVATNRNLSFEHVKKLATGWVYLGEDAKENGLIDEIGLMSDLVDFIELEHNMTAKLVTYESKPGFFSLFSSMSDRGMYFFGKGFASSVLAERDRSQINKFNFWT